MPQLPNSWKSRINDDKALKKIKDILFDTQNSHVLPFDYTCIHFCETHEQVCYILNWQHWARIFHCLLDIMYIELKCIKEFWKNIFQNKLKEKFMLRIYEALRSINTPNCTCHVTVSEIKLYLSIHVEQRHGSKQLSVCTNIW